MYISVMKGVIFSLLLPLAAFAQPYNYYFGNLHAHTAFSDGNKDSATTGVSTPAGSYAYARQSLNFDFLGISEHNHYSSLRNPGFRRQLYSVGLQQADAANIDGTFVALFGMEYGVSSAYHGHVVVYGFNDLLGWETSVPGVAGNNYDVYNSKDDYEGLFTKVKSRPGAFCYLAHPNFDDYSTNGNASGALAFSEYKADFDSAIVSVPLRSGLATTPGDTYSDYPQGNYFNYYKKLLYQGYHVGIGYDHDNHYTNFGRGNGGRMVIMAKNLTRNDLFSAIRQRRFYGSDDANARILFEVNGNIMGSVFTDPQYPVVKLTHTDPDGEKADTIRIWKGRKSSGGLWAQVVHAIVSSDATTFTDYDVLPGLEYYYFAEIRQKDGQWIVTSPVWYTAAEALGSSPLKSAFDFSIYPNPAEKSADLALPSHLSGLVVLRDSHGRPVYRDHFDGSTFTVDLRLIRHGVYTVEVISGTHAAARKLIVE